jgi:predicted dehydrogenase
MTGLILSGASGEACRLCALRLPPGVAVEQAAPSRFPAEMGPGVAAVFVGRSLPPAGEVERLLAAGHPVLLAAEVLLGWEDMDQLSAAARQAGVRLAVVNPDRFLPSRRLLAQHVGRGLGAVGLVRIHRWGAGLDGPSALARDLDLAMWLVGRPPDRVYAVRPNGDAGAHPEPCLLIHLGFPGGAMALIDHAGLPAGDGYCSLSVIGSSGAAHADDHANMQLLYQGNHPQAVRVEEQEAQLATLVEDFLAALDGDPGWGAAEAWRPVRAAVEAVERSLRSHHAVPIGREGP